MRNTFSKGGIHPSANKTASRSIEFLPLPMKVNVPLSQHIGAPARPVVSKGDKVRRGQIIAENASFVSAGLHAPVSGTVRSIENVMMPWGKQIRAIIIEASEEEHLSDTMDRDAYWHGITSGNCDRTISDVLAPDEIKAKINEGGIVGLGGATFPSVVKLSLKPEQKPEVLIINGCECEPYLMCDDALMCMWPARIVEGVELIMKAAGIPRAVIAMEDNKPEAAAAIAAAIDGSADISLRILKTKYPQGGEKQLVEAVTGRRISSGALPISVGAVVNNVATAFAVWQAVATGQPLIERVVTVTGDIAPMQRKNYMVALGTPLADLPFSLDSGEFRILAGGPMMGKTVVRFDAPIMKGTSGLTILRHRPARPEQACMRCGACVDACPMGLEPYLLATYGRLRMWGEARDAAVADCIECGSCSYSCPSARHILDYIRVAKNRAKKL